MDFYATCMSGQPWRKTEDDYLQKFHSRIPVSTLAKTLGRTEHATKQRLRRLLEDKSVSNSSQGKTVKPRRKPKKSRETPDHIRDWLTG